MVAPGISAVYLPIPLGLVMACWWGPRVILGVYLNAVLCAGLWNLPNWHEWPIYALPETLAVFAGWWLFTEVGRGRIWLPTQSDLIKFVLLAVLPAAFFNGFMVSGQLAVLGDMQQGRFWPETWAGGIATMLDGLAFAPALAVYLTPALSARGLIVSTGHTGAQLEPMRHLSKPAAIEIGVAFLGILILSRIAPLERYWSVYGLFVLWAALRYGLPLTVIASLWVELVTLILPVIVKRGVGIPLSIELENVQIALAMLCLSSLIAGRTISDQQDDIRRREVDARALSESEAFLRLSQAAGHAGSWEWDVQSDRIRWSEELIRMHGMSATEFDGELDTVLSFCHPEDLPRLLAAIQEIRLGHDIEEFDCRICPRGGTERHLLFNGQLRRDASGAPIKVLGIAVDITERKHLEQQLRQAHKMEAIGLLAGGISHDFNNLLTVITGYSELLLTSLPEKDASRGPVGTILEASSRAASLTRQLLAFSRRTVLEPQVLDLNKVVRESERLLRRLIGEDIRLVTNLATDLPPIRVDPGQIGQVLMNLAINARDAMPSGGVLTIETLTRVLDEEYVRTHPEAQPGSYVQLSVTDTGTGMTPEVLHRVFEPFFTSKEMNRGTGMGLAVVHGIVKQSDGHIEVFSTPGDGASFRIYLPRVDAGESAADSTRKPIPDVRGTGTIMLVEDDDSVRALSLKVLQECGYRVIAAAEGEEAQRLSARHSEPIDLLVTDVVMPGIGGRVLAERLLAQRPNLKVLYVSGYTDDAVVRQGIIHHEVNFLQKPFTPTSLAMKVREVLAQ